MIQPGNWARCDACGQLTTTRFGVIYDGIWAWLCSRCFIEQRVRVEKPGKKAR